MGQVDEIHQAHRDRQADGQDKQEHAVGNAVKQNGQHKKNNPFTWNGLKAVI
jgi:hypothetical protein